MRTIVVMWASTGKHGIGLRCAGGAMPVNAGHLLDRFCGITPALRLPVAPRQVLEPRFLANVPETVKPGCQSVVQQSRNVTGSRRALPALGEGDEEQPGCAEAARSCARIRGSGDRRRGAPSRLLMANICRAPRRRAAGPRWIAPVRGEPRTNRAVPTFLHNRPAAAKFSSGAHQLHRILDRSA